MSGIQSSGAWTSVRYLAPSRAAGNTFTMSAPCSNMLWISVGEKAAGTVTVPVSRAIWKISGVKQMGESMKRLPASAAAWARSGVVTVPAPTRTSSPNSSTSLAMVSAAPGVFMATSTADSLVPTSCCTTQRHCS